jgi:ribulose-phosphate 3-epimerase
MKKKSIAIEPSLLSADFGKLAEEAVRMEKAGADAIHFDIMDGHFVPNLTLGPKALAAVNRATPLFLDVHIMVYHPYEFIESLAKSGADRITFHFEATEDVEDTIQFIRRCNLQAGLAFCPETPFSMVEPFIAKCDLILLMTVHPGFGGQSFMSEVLEKIKLTREFCDRHHIRHGGVNDTSHKLPPFEIQVDGGINMETAKKCVKAGANNLVSGNFLLSQKNLKEAIQSLRSHVLT